MISAYNLAQYIIIIEFGLVILLILLVIVLKYFYIIRENRIQNTIKQIKYYLQNAKPNQTLAFPKKWKRLSYIIPIINQLDDNPPHAYWQEIRTNLLEKIVLPQARKDAQLSSRHWIKRFYAAKAFSLAPHKEDESYILNLINDPIPLVYLNILHAAIVANSKNAIYAIINNAAAQRRLTQGTYINEFRHAPPEVTSTIIDYLKQVKDPYIRVICYKLLLRCPPHETTLKMTDDMYSNNLELRLSSIRYFTDKNKLQAIPILKEMLQDPQWEVRLTVLEALGSLNSYDNISDIEKCLHDPQWWVRIHAGEILKNMGNRGLQILQQQDPEKDKFAYQVAQYVLANAQGAL